MAVNSAVVGILLAALYDPVWTNGIANGADFAINYSTEDIREKVKEYVGGADVVYDPVSGDAFMASLRWRPGPSRRFLRDTAEADES